MQANQEIDSDNAFWQVRSAIKGLMNFQGEDDEDDVIYAANKLNFVLRVVHDNHRAWNDETIRDFVLIQNDPLKHLSVKSEKLNHIVRKIQQDMIVNFS